ncbi:hypothetical protein ACHMW5_04100 [Azospirillum melinis]|uniref:hypothetical protein n=1 Tax=Azospirillum melinis TaxID=328839 RepID=UPI003757D637
MMTLDEDAKIDIELNERFLAANEGRLRLAMTHDLKWQLRKRTDEVRGTAAATLKALRLAAGLMVVRTSRRHRHDARAIRRRLNRPDVPPRLRPLDGRPADVHPGGEPPVPTGRRGPTVFALAAAAGMLSGHHRGLLGRGGHRQGRS